MLFCLTANYTPKALEAMGKNPSNRREAVEKLLTAAGGKLVAMYGTIAEGPGAMAIFDIDPAAAPAVVGVVASSDAVHNVKMQRLFSGEEVAAIRQKRAQLQASYKPPGQYGHGWGGNKPPHPSCQVAREYHLKTAKALGQGNSAAALAQ